MAQIKRSPLDRIRTVKSSLDNAEQSFSSNQEIRGELDLMLAEAELKNLRRKKDRPWSWNRQILAGMAAVLLVVAAVGGWYLARDHYKTRYNNRLKQQLQVQKPAEQVITGSVPVSASQAEVQAKENVTAVTDKQEQNPAAPSASAQVNISKAEMHKLVHQARTELNNSQ